MNEHPVENLNWEIAAKKPKIALDFDGVLHDYSGWNGVIPTGPPVDGALNSVNWLLNHGFDPFIMSTRAQEPGGREAIQSWLAEHEFPVLEVTHHKNHAELYVDDRGFRFEGPQSWEALLVFLQENPIPGRWGSGNL